MNKKFSTLMMGGMLLAVPSLVSAQGSVSVNDKVLTPVTFKTGNDGSNTQQDPVFVIRDNGDGVIGANDYIFIAKKSGNSIIYTIEKVPTDGKVTIPNEDEALWSFEETKMGDTPDATSFNWYYSLKNKQTGKYFTGDLTNAFVPTVVTDFEKSLGSAGKSGNLTTYLQTDGSSAATRMVNNDLLYLYGASDANQLQINSTPSTQFAAGITNATIIIATAEPRTVGVDVVDELNDIKGGKGFEFEVQTEGDVIDNIFDGLELRAFRVDVNGGSMESKDSIGWEANGNYYEIPAGIYLATDWSQLDDATLANNTITSKEEFQKATFVVVSPTDFTEITNTVRADGTGFTLTTAKGSEMNFYSADVATENDKYNANLDSKADEVYVGNACFTITAQKPLAENDVYQLAVNAARLKIDKDKDAHVSKTVYISAVTNTNNVDDDVDNLKYLVTNKDASKVAKVKAIPSSTIANVTELLHQDATPAIYAVKFLSGEEDEVSEYGQYLTWESNGSFTAAAMPSVNDGANENDPLYQWVVTGVADENKDDEYEVVTLTNRLTQQSVSAVLYDEEELGDKVFTIYPSQIYDRDQKLQVATTKDGKLVLEDKAFRGMVVQLIEKEDVDKFATFETTESEEGLYTFEFAKTAESGDRLYAAAKRDAKTGEIDYDAEDNLNIEGGVITSETPDQFELIRVKESATSDKDKVTYILNDFIYLSNGRPVASPIEKDTVAFYSYNIRFFAPDEETPHYLNGGNLSETASAHIIKYNVDGSVSLFDEAADEDFLTSGIPNAKAKYLVVHDELQTNTLTINEENNIGIRAWTWGAYYDYQTAYNTLPVKTFMVPETVFGTLNPVPQTTAFEEVNGFGYVNMNEKKQAILLPSESMTFRLDTVDTDANIPSFYISKDNNFLYFAKDSADSYRLTDWTKYEFENGTSRATRLIFKAGELVDDSQALQTMVDGKSVKVAEKADRVNGVLGGLNNFKFQVLESGDGDDTYVIRNKQEKKYVITINGTLTVASNLAGATRFLVNPEELATANDDITVSSVKVIAGDGQITINGAAGKKVVVSNILGQVVANTVISSDNATIAAPQGIVVVAVEGEEAVKAIVK